MQINSPCCLWLILFFLFSHIQSSIKLWWLFLCVTSYPLSFSVLFFSSQANLLFLSLSYVIYTLLCSILWLALFLCLGICWPSVLLKLLLLYFLYWSIVDLQCFSIQQNDSHTHIQTFFFRFFSIIGYYKILKTVPCAIQ